MRTPTLEDMWKTIERYGIKREILEKFHATAEDVSELYRIIKKRTHAHREQEMIRLLKEYVEKMKNRDKSYCLM
jgi:hypothetical protein